MQVQHHPICMCADCKSVHCKCANCKYADTADSTDGELAGELVSDRYETETHMIYAVSQHRYHGTWYVEFKSIPRNPLIDEEVVGIAPLRRWNTQVLRYQSK